MRCIPQSIFVFSLVVLLVPSLASGVTWNIKPDGTGDAATIQAGIDLATAGDIILLAPGTYTGVGNRDISYNGKAVTVTSSGGAAVTIIDCQSLGRGFDFTNGEGTGSVLSGVTVENGLSGSGGGGAVRCLGAAPSITDNIFRTNREGAIVLDQSASLVENNEFHSNSTNNIGGGVWCFSCTAVISNNRFEGNSANTWGGGVALFEAETATVSGNVFHDNTAPMGAGLGCKYGFNSVTGNVFYENIATQEGGGIYVFNASPDVRNNTMSENDALVGGGMYCDRDFDLCEPIVEQNIITFSAHGEGIACGNGASPTLTCNDIFGNAGGDALCGVDGGYNISVDPIFCGSPGSGGYSISFGSPCAAASSPCEGLIGALPPQCSPVPVSQTTWGGIKAMYGDD